MSETNIQYSCIQSKHYAYYRVGHRQNNLSWINSKHDEMISFKLSFRHNIL